MLSSLVAVLLFTCQALAQGCTSQRKISAIAQEIKTIKSHSAADAALIPLDPLASRTFFVTPNETSTLTVPVNVGATADTVRAELVLLATGLNAGVPDNSIHYIVNSNGTVTSDFIQTDDIVLREVNVREIHSFNAKCEILKITGFVHGPLILAGVGL